MTRSVPAWSVRATAHAAMAAAAARSSDARRAAARVPAGSAPDVARADAWTALADRRCAHLLAMGADPDEVQRDGLVSVPAAAAVVGRARGVPLCAAHT